MTSSGRAMRQSISGPIVRDGSPGGCLPLCLPESPFLLPLVPRRRQLGGPCGDSLRDALGERCSTLRAPTRRSTADQSLPMSPSARSRRARTFTPHSCTLLSYSRRYCLWVRRRHTRMRYHGAGGRREHAEAFRSVSTRTSKGRLPSMMPGAARYSSAPTSGTLRVSSPQSCWCGRLLLSPRRGCSFNPPKGTRCARF